MHTAKFLHRDDYNLLPGVDQQAPYSKQSISEAMKHPQYLWVKFAVIVRQGLMLFANAEELNSWRTCQDTEEAQAVHHSMTSGNSQYGTWKQRHAT